MLNKYIGYAGINTVLSAKGIRSGKGCKLITLKREGLPAIARLAISNAKHLHKILEWNLNHDILFFRIGSELIPWWDHFEFTELPRYDELQEELMKCGDFARKNNMRLTTHPGPYTTLASKTPDVAQRAALQLLRHSQFYDLMGYKKSTVENKINIHVGGHYNDKSSTLKRWCKNFNDLLDDRTKSRVTIENDDKPSMFSVNDLQHIHNETGVPIVFDYHHHKFCTGGQTEEQALKQAIATWPKGIIPVVHYSESADNKRPQAHSDYITALPNTYGNQVHIMIEAKMKEQAVLKSNRTILCGSEQ